MSWESFVIGAALTAIVFAIVSGARQAYQTDKENNLKKKKHAHEHIDINEDRFKFRGDIAELFERIAKLEKSDKKFHEWFSILAEKKRR